MYILPTHFLFTHRNVSFSSTPRKAATSLRRTREREIRKFFPLDNKRLEMLQSQTSNIMPYFSTQTKPTPYQAFSPRSSLVEYNHIPLYSYCRIASDHWIQKFRWSKQVLFLPHSAFPQALCWKYECNLHQMQGCSHPSHQISEQQSCDQAAKIRTEIILQPQTHISKMKNSIWKKSKTNGKERENCS